MGAGGELPVGDSNPNLNEGTTQMTSHEHHAKLATNWACQTLALLNCEIEPIGNDSGWYIETPTGWKWAHDWRELVDVAKDVKKAWQIARKNEQKVQ